jgi:transposase
MEPQSESAHTVWSFPFTPQDWDQTPPAVQASLRPVCDALGQLQARVEALDARLKQNSTTSSRPPSSDSPYEQSRQRTTATTSRKAGGKPGHPGHRQGLLPPPTVQARRPERCACGTTTLALTAPYHTHQVLARPPVALDVKPWGLHQG